MQRVRVGALVPFLALQGLIACASPDRPGPLGRAGAQIDHAVADAERGIGDFSVRVSDGVDQAGRAVGATAQRVGSSVHSWLAPDERSKGNVFPDGRVLPGP
jgi:hypothetical protein